tara:strand:+ start:917 stop:1366 length:450 start_codon:yes stop_codon:yes gene_type:complete
MAENDRDRQNENTVRAAIAGWFNCDLVSFPQYSFVDWLGMRDGDMTALIEFKEKRTSDLKKYPDVIMDEHKVFKLLTLQDALKIDAYIFVRMKHGEVLYIKADAVPQHRIRNIGGTDRPRVEAPEQKAFLVDQSMFRKAGVLSRDREYA